MRKLRAFAAFSTVLGLMLASAAPVAAASACRKKCDDAAQACSRGKSDTTPCTKTWLQCKKGCDAPKPAQSPAPAPK